MKQSLLNQVETADNSEDKPGLSNVIERNIRTIIHLRREADRRRGLQERAADAITLLSGRMLFAYVHVIWFSVWILLNTGSFGVRPFDPYPFILLNLMLSFLASLQAPVIMMSQNRQEARDRQHAEGDYKVNLKAELEIRHLHEKMDYLLHQHTTRLMEVQQIQIDLLRDLAHGRRKTEA